MKPHVKIILSKPRGFCAGVERAVEIVDLALQLFSPPIYVRKEIVHNRFVVEHFRRRGVIFVDELNEVPEGELAIFSAHGIAPAVWEEAKRRRLRTVDATCPLVTKVHLEVHRFVTDGYHILLIGHKGHDEVIGTMGESPENIRLITSIEEANTVEVPNPEKVVYLTQTTLSVDETKEIVDALKLRFPKLIAPPKDDICYATQNRQWAVKELAKVAQLVLVVGVPNSSNSVRLREVAQSQGVTAHLIGDETEIQEAWLLGVDAVGITAGASAPEILVKRVTERIKEMGTARDGKVEMGELEVTTENIRFALPQELTEALKRSSSPLTESELLEVSSVA